MLQHFHILLTVVLFLRAFSSGCCILSLSCICVSLLDVFVCLFVCLFVWCLFTRLFTCCGTPCVKCHGVDSTGRDPRAARVGSDGSVRPGIPGRSHVSVCGSSTLDPAWAPCVGSSMDPVAEPVAKCVDVPARSQMAAVLFIQCFQTERESSLSATSKQHTPAEKVRSWLTTTECCPPFIYFPDCFIHLQSESYGSSW